MSKFKVGDKVRRTAGSDRMGGLLKGVVGTVSEVPSEGRYLIRGCGNYTHFEEYLESANSVQGVVTKESNPKEAIGSTKLDFSLVPDSAIAYMVTAFTEGALKYGSYNWRVAGVRASTYYAAMRRHQKKWWNGQNEDPKTRVHHLANAMACQAIILDAELCKLLTDDRPPTADVAGLIEQLEGTVAHLKDISKGHNPHHCTALNPTP